MTFENPGRGAASPSPAPREDTFSPRSLGDGLPTFLIIGAMRSGTTAIARYLADHPDTCMSRRKELHFFDSNYEKGLNWYRGHFPTSAGKKTIGEATPLYMYDSTSIKRMAELLPHAKLVAILRHPVDRAYSHYWHHRSRDRDDLSFADAVRAEPDRISQSRYNRLHFSYIDRGRYIRQLEEVSRYYPRERIHVSIYEDFFSSLMDSFRDLCRYLDIDDTFLPQVLGENFGFRTAIRSVRVERLSKRMEGRGARLLRRLNATTASRPPMDPSVREQLLATFRGDNEKLAVWLGRSLEAWSK